MLDFSDRPMLFPGKRHTKTRLRLISAFAPERFEGSVIVGPGRVVVIAHDRAERRVRRPGFTRGSLASVEELVADAIPSKLWQEDAFAEIEQPVGRVAASREKFAQFRFWLSKGDAVAAPTNLPSA